jgi:hypothetical protein
MGFLAISRQFSPAFRNRKITVRFPARTMIVALTLAAQSQ